MGLQPLRVAKIKPKKRLKWVRVARSRPGCGQFLYGEFPRGGLQPRSAHDEEDTSQRAPAAAAVQLTAPAPLQVPVNRADKAAYMLQMAQQEDMQLLAAYRRCQSVGVLSRVAGLGGVCAVMAPPGACRRSRRPAACRPTQTGGQSG